MHRRLFRFFLPLLFISTTSSAQWSSYRTYGPDAGKTSFKRLDFKIDTIDYQGNEIVRQRANREQLNKYKGGDRQAANKLIEIETDLENRDGRAAFAAISDIKDIARDVDLDIYRAEAQAYFEEGERRKASVDSLKLANAIAEKKKEQEEDSARKLHYLGMSREDIIRDYGSLEEYESGRAIMSRSGTFRTVLIGHPTAWAGGLLAYMSAPCGCQIRNENKDLFFSGDLMWINFRAFCPGGAVDVKIDRTGNWDDAKATGITITGDAAVLSKVFLGFWENTAIPESKLKKGALLSQNFMTDHITFNWKGAKPFIKISAVAGSNTDAAGKK